MIEQDEQYIGVYREILADCLTPIAVYEFLSSLGGESILLESGLKQHSSSSFSFIGAEPYATFMTYHGETTIVCEGEKEVRHESPMQLLRFFHHRFRCKTVGDSSLLGQMMGIFSYESVRYFENIKLLTENNNEFPDILFHFYRVNIVFDHVRDKLLIAVVKKIDNDIDAVCKQAEAEIVQLIENLSNMTFRPIEKQVSITKQDFSVDASEAEYVELVNQAKKFIQQGDVFQLVLSRIFQAKLHTCPLNVYRTLRNLSPTSYLFYFNTPEFTLFGASPEKLVNVQNGVVTTLPIAGTLPRCAAATQDELEQLLLHDEKQCAEHIMLVDSARNDLSKVCIPGSVKVTELMRCQHLSEVTHLVSVVKGHLMPTCDAFDALQAVFPAGTLTGAPKIRAMELIADFENAPRQAYGGAICRVDHEGNLDSCIITRSALVKGDTLYTHAGAGIVFDYQADDEAAETYYKSQIIISALQFAERRST